MVVVNTENIPGREYQVISLVTGCCVMCKNIGKDIGASFRNMVGGEMQAYTQMMADAGGAEILVSGTAVKFTA